MCLLINNLTIVRCFVSSLQTPRKKVVPTSYPILPSAVEEETRF